MANCIPKLTKRAVDTLKAHGADAVAGNWALWRARATELWEKGLHQTCA